MKFHPLAQLDFQGPRIEPLPPRRQAWHQRAILVEFDEVFEDVDRDRGPIAGALIHNPQFPPRRWNLFPPTGMTPPEDDEHEDDATDDESFHGIPPCLHE